MASVLLDSEGVIHADFLPHGITISAQYYNNLLHNDVHYAIRKKIPEKPSKKTILLHENACPQTANLAKATLASVGWETVNHPPYSPDLAPSLFHLFRAMKAHIGRQKFQIQTRCSGLATLCCWHF
jgi:transposase